MKSREINEKVKKAGKMRPYGLEHNIKVQRGKDECVLEHRHNISQEMRGRKK